MSPNSRRQCLKHSTGSSAHHCRERQRWTWCQCEYSTTFILWSRSCSLTLRGLVFSSSDQRCRWASGRSFHLNSYFGHLSGMNLIFLLLIILAVSALELITSWQPLHKYKQRVLPSCWLILPLWEQIQSALSHFCFRWLPLRRGPALAADTSAADYYWLLLLDKFETLWRAGCRMWGSSVLILHIQLHQRGRSFSPAGWNTSFGGSCQIFLGIK